MTLSSIWFFLVAVLFIGYAILDGFDLGVGVLHLFSRNEHERRVSLNAIGPVWDGNEVWLLTGGGALFAAFPAVYATVFSGFYLALMLLLVALIFRAVSLEFRGKVAAPGWRALWDGAFGIGSLLPAVLFGVAFGNILRGVPIDENGMWAGSFLGLLNPYALLVGVLTLALFCMHGAIYLAMKTDGTHRDRLVAWATRGWIAVVMLYVLATLASMLAAPFLFDGVMHNVLSWVLFLVFLAGTLVIPLTLKARAYFRAFLGSSAMIAGMIGLAAVSLFPRLVPSSIDLAYSLTIANSSSTPASQTVMLIIALIGMPLVVAYTIVIHRVFRGKVRITGDSY
jgi:cytochrome d ubiquinol oxidase subunit II